MDIGLRGAAQFGSINALYALIQDDADVLRRIDQMEFVDTPLHIAAAAGHTDFAMEMMNLKPSFARKLNQGGFSPIHLALQREQTEMVVDLLSIDKELVRVKGREGYTPLHIVARDGNVPLLSQFLKECPNCILDLTIRKETALHIVARNNKLEAFKLIMQWIQNNPEDNQFQRRRILNLQDKDGNTILHIAASNNQPEMIKLLTKCKEVDTKAINHRGFTPLDVSQRQSTQMDCRESVNILYHAKDNDNASSKEINLRTFSPRTSIFSKFTHDIEEMKPDTINILLVVFALTLTMTYDALLSPPGGVLQGDAAGGSNTTNVGKSIMNSYTFIMFYASNFGAFIISWAITLALLVVVAKRVMYFMFPVYLLLCFVYSLALFTIQPEGFAAWSATLAGSMVAFLILGISLCIFRK